MSFDLRSLDKCVAVNGAVVRVLVSGTKGSAPRDVGATMLVWQGGQSGTIGGGALEHQASVRARDMLIGPVRVAHITQPLGPGLGQCCGGNVTLVLERFEAHDLPSENTHIFARAVDANASAKIPALLQRRIDAAKETPIEPILTAGWLAESLRQMPTPVWIYGAGHVGRALARTLAPLNGYDITLIDTVAARLPKHLPQNITPLAANTMADLVRHAPDNAHHYIMTMDHGFDLEICHQLLHRKFGFAGLIGSKTKWARFQSRLEQLGHTHGEICRITCPIGDPALGKEPQTIAVGIAHALLLERATNQPSKEIIEGRGI